VNDWRPGLAAGGDIAGVINHENSGALRRTGAMYNSPGRNNMCDYYLGFQPGSAQLKGTVWLALTVVFNILHLYLPSGLWTNIEH
jgi:hypothetical protein